MKWKIVVSVLCLLAVTACGTIKLSNANQHAVTITIHDNYFSPNAITVPPRQPVKITLINMGVNVHIVEIKGLTPEAPLQPGQSASFTVTPQARAYQIYDELYVVDGMTGTLSGGTGPAPGGATPAPVATIAQAIGIYRSYTLDQANNLVSVTQQFTDAVQLGNLAAAKTLYPVAHQFYERIEPIAEQFPALDLAFDARIDAVPMAQWRGLHRLEQATPRNLMGFKDGTDNLKSEDVARLNQDVWVGANDQPPWMAGGSYLVTRRIRMHAAFVCISKHGTATSWLIKRRR